MSLRAFSFKMCTVSFAVLFAAALLSGPIYADSVPGVTLASTNATVTEGDSGTVTVTVTNDSSFQITTSSVSFTFGPVLGDSSDALDNVGINTSNPLNTCTFGVLGIDASCNWVLTFTTSSPAGETDHDSGVETNTFTIHYDIAAIGEGYSNTVDYTVTVNDPGVTSTPEPSSLLLLGSGAFTLLGSLRRRLLFKL
jgi:hypothetical protein